MKQFRNILFFLAITSLTIGLFLKPTQAHAWWYSDYATVKVPIKPLGINMIDAVNCISAKLSYGGKSYTAAVHNPLLSNNCTFTFSKVYVKYSGYYSLQFTYKYLFTTKTRTTTVYVTKPLYSGTYTTSTKSYYP